MELRCNAVAPGRIDTELDRECAERLPDRDEAVAALGDPEDAAAVVAFLPSRDSGFVSGQVITVDGADDPPPAHLESKPSIAIDI